MVRQCRAFSYADIKQYFLIYQPSLKEEKERKKISADNARLQRVYPDPQSLPSYLPTHKRYITFVRQRYHKNSFQLHLQPPTTTTMTWVRTTTTTVI